MVEAVTWIRSRRILRARVTSWRVPTLGETGRSGQLIAKSSSIAEFAHQAYHIDTVVVNDDSPIVSENGRFAAVPANRHGTSVQDRSPEHCEKFLEPAMLGS